MTDNKASPQAYNSYILCHWLLPAMVGLDITMDQAQVYFTEKEVT